MTKTSSLGSQDILKECKTILHEKFQSEKGWIKIHAAEALMSLGERAKVHTGIVAITEPWNQSTKIGKWRVLYQCSTDHSEKQSWIGKIEDCYTNVDGSVRLNALESLCKLSFVAVGQTLEMIRSDSTDRTKIEAPFALWALHLAGDHQAVFKIADTLRSPMPEIRKMSAFCLRWMKCTDPGALNTLSHCADTEPPDSEAWPYILGAAISLKADTKRSPRWKSDLISSLKTADNLARYEICQALKDEFFLSDLEALLPLLTQPDVDVQIGASTAIISLLARSVEPHFCSLNVL